MNLISLLSMTIKTGLVVACLLTFSIAKAATVNLTAEYKPDISDLGHTKFKNTTEITGTCAKWPAICLNNQFSIEIPDLSVIKRMISGTETLRNSVAIKLDARGRSLVLTDGSGNALNVRFTLTDISFTRAAVGGRSGNPWPITPRGGCTTSTGIRTEKWFAVAWRFPKDSTSTCWLLYQSDVTINEDYKFYDIGVGYALEIDSPIGLTNGTYSGEVVYSVGSGGDIEFWGHTYSDTEIRFVVTATVQHDFNLQFPAGSNQVNLEPTGGWGQWLNYGRTPARLERNVQFGLTTSNPVNISLQCQHSVGSQCGLRNLDTGDLVGLETRVSLPALKAADGSHAQEVLLTSDAAGQTFSPTQYVYQRNAQVHFRVNKPEVETMLKQPGSRWGGQVTLMFDAGL